jgi:hypothetical protein
LFSAVTCHAAGLEDPAVNVPQRLVEVSLNQEVPANDPRVSRTREQLAQVMKATGETEQAVAQACMRNARYIFDFSRQRVSPLEVLEVLARYAPPGKPLNDTTQVYFNLRVKQKLGHAEAMKAMATPAGSK